VLRFLADDVGKELDAVLDAILRVLSRRTNTPLTTRPLTFMRGAPS
jgi:very-short-patch-repair endonuclease